MKKILLTTVFAAFAMTASAATLTIHPALDTSRAMQVSLSKNKAENIIQQAILSWGERITDDMRTVESGYRSSGSTDDANWAGYISGTTTGTYDHVTNANAPTLTYTININSEFDDVQLGSITIVYTAAPDSATSRITHWTGTIDLSGLNVGDDSTMVGDTDALQHKLLHGLGWPFSALKGAA